MLTHPNFTIQIRLALFAFLACICEKLGSDYLCKSELDRINNYGIDHLQEAGGWNSPAMPLRYVETAKIANEGVNLG